MDEYFPKDARSSAQGLFNFLILGFGPFVGNFVWPELQGFFTTSTSVDGQVVSVVNYQGLFLVPSATLLAAILLALFFHPPASAVQMIAEDEGIDAPVPQDEGQIAAGFPKDERGIRR